MKGNNHIIFAVIVLTFMSVKGLAQDACEVRLNDALREFNAGHFYAIPALLKECLEKKQSAEYQQRAYLLLAQAYLLLDEPMATEDAYLRVLKANPEYRTSPATDPIDLVYLSDKFTAAPMFSLYGKIGPNLSPIKIINDISVSGERTTKEQYSLKPGWQAGAGIEWHYSRTLSIAGEMNFSRDSYSHSSTNLFGIGKDELLIEEKLDVLKVPFLLRYTDRKGVFRPFVFIGYAFNYLISDQANLSIVNRNVSQNTDDSSVPPTILSKEGLDIDFTSKRTLFTQSMVVGTGFKSKVKFNYFFIDVRYSFGLKNAANQKERYDDVLYQWPYVDDDFRIDNVILSVGYVKPLYKPRKVKRRMTAIFFKRKE